MSKLRHRIVVGTDTETLTFAKLFFSLVVAFAAQSAMANVQLEAQITPLNPGVGSQSKFVRIYKSGEVQVQFCDVATGACTNPTYITTLSWYAMNHIMNQTEFARSGHAEIVTRPCRTRWSDPRLFWRIRCPRMKSLGRPAAIGNEHVICALRGNVTFFASSLGLVGDAPRH